MDYDNLPERLALVANLKEFADSSGIHRRTLQRVMTRAVSPTLRTCDLIDRQLRAIKPAKRKP